MEIPRVPDIPEGWVPVETAAVFECIDENGHTSLCVRYTEEITHWKAIGMLQSALDGMRRQLLDELGEE